MSDRTPLAWKNLTHDRRRLLVAMSGIAFAVVLMFQQRGFNHALFDSTVEVVQELDCDLILFNPTRFALSNEIRFRRDAMDIAASTRGVEGVIPLYLENVAARFRAPGFRARPIRVLAWNLDRPLFVDSRGELAENFELLGQPETALMDRFSKQGYGVELRRPTFQRQSVELSGKHLDIVGLFQLGRDFAHEGNLIMSAENFRNYFPYRGVDPLGVVDLGIVQVEPGTNVNELVTRLNERLGGEVEVLTKAQFVDKEIGFWARNTPIGVIFAIGAVMGFVVGVIICYQILANDITEHLGEFATLKAMGYGNRYFVHLVVRQSIYLALLGFLPGLVFSWLLFQFNSSMTGLLMRMTWDRTLTIFLATMLMCIVSGLLALRKLLAADPASLF